MSTLTIPLDLPVTIYLSERESTVTRTRDILAIPTTVTGKWDGPSGPAAPAPPFIRFSIGWFAGIAGFGADDLGRAVSDLAAHLAGHDGSWPGTEAHVRCLPVVDAGFQFLVTPQCVAPAHEGPPQGLAETILLRMEGISPEAAVADQPLPTAYCAPGRKAVAELVLTLRGERFSEVTEHPWLEGSTDAWLVAPLDDLLTPPLPVFSPQPDPDPALSWWWAVPAHRLPLYPCF